MPTIKQLPVATSVATTDLLPVSQGGVTRGLTIGGLLSSAQTAISLAPSKLLGRVSVTAGGPEPVGVGTGLAVVSGSLVGTGADHATLPIAAGVATGDEVIVNSGGVAKRMQSALLRGLFSPGSGVTIDASGTISASSVASAVATAATLGAVKVGPGLSISASGTLALSSVWDYGVAVNTMADQAQAFGLAVGSAAVNLSVPPGDYLLNGVVELGPNQTMELTGTRFSGAGVIADGVDWSAFYNRTTKAWLRKSNEGSNAFGTITTMDIGVSGSTISYEKAAGYDIAITADQSSYSGSGTAWAGVSTLDAVGRQMNGIIRAGNMTGRVWGLTAGAQVPAGGDGSAAAAEFDVVNDSGIDQPYCKQPTSKTGIGLIALGTTPSTTAAIVAAGGTTWHDGFVVLQDAVSGTAFRIIRTGSVTDDTFHVTPDGSLMAQSGLFVAGLTAPTPAANDSSTQVATTAFVQTALQGGASLPVQAVPVSGPTQTLSFVAGARETSLAVTLNSSSVFTVVGAVPGYDQLMTIELMQGATAGNTASFPNVSWAGGIPPMFNTVAGKHDTIQLRAFGADVMGWPVSMGRVPLASGVPDVPSGMTVAQGILQNSIDVMAAAATLAISGYNIYGSNTSGLYSSVPLASNVSLPYVESGLTAGVTRYYRVAAINGVGVGPMSAEGSGTPIAASAPGSSALLPAAPGSIAVTPGNRQNLISVAAVVASPAVVGYTINRGASAGSEATVPIATNVSIPYIDAGLANGTTYFYTVAAVSSSGTGPASAEASATPEALVMSPMSPAHYALFSAVDAVVYASPSSAFNPGNSPFEMQAYINAPSWAVGGLVEMNIWGCWDLNAASRLWRLGLTTDGRIRASWATGPSSDPTATSLVAIAAVGGTDLWIRASVTPSTGTVAFFTSIDGATWVQLGAPQTASGSGAVYTPGTLPYLVIGANASAPAGPQAEQFFGRLYEARLLIAGVLITDPTSSANGVVDSRGFAYAKSAAVTYV